MPSWIQSPAFWATGAIFLLGSGPAQAQLTCPGPVVNAGVVRTGTALVREFCLVNAGNQPIAITAAHASCGCLAPRLSQRNLAPGETATLTMEVNTLSQSAGLHTWQTDLTYHQGTEEAQLTLQLQARILCEVTIQPARLIVFAEHSKEHELIVSDSRARPLSIRAVHTSAPGLTPTILLPEASAPAGNPVARIRLDIGQDLADGRTDEVLQIYTDDPAYPEIRVPVTVIKQQEQRFTALPHEVTWKAAPGQPIPARIVLLRDNTAQAVRVTHVVADDPAVACQWAAGPDKMATLKIRIDRAKIPGDRLQSAVHVELAGEREPLTIPIDCRVR